LYFSWLILLFGAQVAYTFQYRRAYLQERQTETVNQRGREFVALRMAAVIGEHFQEGRRAPAASEIAETLGVPVRLVHQVGDALLASGLITRVANDEVAYLPGRPLERITVHDVLLAMRAGQGKELLTLDGPARSLVRGEYERIEAAERRVSSSVSLLDVVHRLSRNMEVLTAGAPASSPPETESRPANDRASQAEVEVQDIEPVPDSSGTRPVAPEHRESSEKSASTASETSEAQSESGQTPPDDESPTGKPDASVGGQSFPL
jgi:DNA-binding IscR family transcriptional regulator